MKYLLDTSVIVDAINNKRRRRELLHNLLTAGSDLGCCTIHVIEVYSGMHSHEERITSDFLDSFEYYDVTRQIARLAGELRYAWARKGHALSLADSAVAAVALHHNLALITDNRKHYPMPEIILYSLSAA
ncbi:MAG: type II toxin-antitoxin system VapC family toxin [Bryobacteraceae bacterium]